MEIWDLYDENGNLTGRDHVRGEKVPEGYFHLVVHVWIKNAKEEYLIAQRAADRPTFPLMWECVGGSAVKGENGLQGAVREVKEEVGIDLSPENGKLVFSKVRKHFNDIVEVWLFDYDGDIDLKNATTAEVAQTAWLNRDEIKALFEQGRFVDTLEYFFTEIDVK